MTSNDHGDADIRVTENIAGALGDHAIGLEQAQACHPDRAERRQRDGTLRVDDDLHAVDVETADDLNVEHIARSQSILRTGDIACLLSEVQVAPARGERGEGARRAWGLRGRRGLRDPGRRGSGCRLADSTGGRKKADDKGEREGPT